MLQSIRTWQDKLLVAKYNYQGPVELKTTGSPADLVDSLRYGLLTADYQKVKDLLAAGADPRLADDEGAEPVHDAAMGGDPRLLQLLLDLGADPKQQSSLGRTPLGEAVELARVECVDLLLRAGGAPDMDAPTIHKLINDAVMGGSIPLVKLLIDAGVPIQPENAQRYSALHTAAAYGLPKMIEFLVNSCAAPLEILDTDSDESPLITATANGKLENVQVLLSLGADIEQHNSYEETAMHYAAGRGNEEMILLLLRQGADVQEGNKRGVTPLMHAASNGKYWKKDEQCISAVQTLLSHGANIEAVDQYGWTPLFHAIQAVHCRVVELLLEKDADTRHRDAKGRSPLALAVGRQQLDSYDDRSPFRPTNRQEDMMYEMVTILLQKAGKLHWKTKRSLVKRAESTRSPEMVQLLKEW